MRLMRVTAAVAVAAVSLVASGGLTKTAGWPGARADSGLTVEVTNTGDSVAAEASVCPDATKCTLRRAIERVNADASGAPYTIRFNPTVFSAVAPATITVLGTPLPAITRSLVAVDASNAGVRIDGGNASGLVNGLVILGGHSTVFGLSVHHFLGTCISSKGDSTLIGGDSALHRGNRVGGCPTGIATSGPSAVIGGNRIGFLANGDGAANVAVGVLVTGANSVIGNDSGTAGLANVIGNAGVAVAVGDGTGAAFTGTNIARNIIGQDSAGGVATVETGVDLRQPSSGATVRENAIFNATRAGVRVAPDLVGVAVSGNRFVANRFQNIGTLAIDLAGDGIIDPPGGLPPGPNHWRGYPTITRATQARITGNAPGCGGCSIELYLAAHVPGGASDNGTTPVLAALATTDGLGNFAFDSAPVTPGQWVTALVTDAQGNTSEFGPSGRVGAGVVQCGNVELRVGWNHAGFFGLGPTTLGSDFPADPANPGHVSAIYRLMDGTDTFTHWFSETSIGRTLDSLDPGEAYWFLSEEPVSLAQGFGLTVPLPVLLKAGWNDFVYIGATADVRDALGSISGKYGELYRFVNGGSGGRWTTFGKVDTPAWARDFSNMEACGTYEIFVTQDVTLVPLQP